jgi:hypothetical protein
MHASFLANLTLVDLVILLIFDAEASYEALYYQYSTTAYHFVRLWARCSSQHSTLILCRVADRRQKKGASEDVLPIFYRTQKIPIRYGLIVFEQ